jgi:hypothetical protein
MQLMKRLRQKLYYFKDKALELVFYSLEDCMYRFLAGNYYSGFIVGNKCYLLISFHIIIVSNSLLLSSNYYQIVSTLVNKLSLFDYHS